MSECILFRVEDLLPTAWRRFLTEGPVRAFNPGLLRDGDGWLFAYRIVGPDGLRRIALCRLDAQLRVIDDSAKAFTDRVNFHAKKDLPEIATQWFADPRLYQFGRRVFIYWNSGWHEPQNHQFLQEFDTSTLLPVGAPRELLLRPRQKLEKNWTFFEASNGSTYAVYSILPHRILQFSLSGDGPIEFAEVASTPWALGSYPAAHGGLRGGAPPYSFDGSFWSFCHSVHDGPFGYRYAAAVYRFGAELPFGPNGRPKAPFALAERESTHRDYPRLNPAVDQVVYPCGAARDGARWLISHGINDERCAISVLSDAEVATQLEAVTSS
jgi:hypothetical protein